MSVSALLMNLRKADSPEVMIFPSNAAVEEPVFSKVPVPAAIVMLVMLESAVEVALRIVMTLISPEFGTNEVSVEVAGSVKVTATLFGV